MLVVDETKPLSIQRMGQRTWSSKNLLLVEFVLVVSKSSLDLDVHHKKSNQYQKFVHHCLIIVYGALTRHTIPRVRLRFDKDIWHVNFLLAGTLTYTRLFIIINVVKSA